MKLVENCEEPLKNKSKTYYVRKDDNWSNYDNWKNGLRTRGYVILDSYPKFFRTASRNNYIRGNSKLTRQGSNFRDGSKLGSNF